MRTTKEVENLFLKIYPSITGVYRLGFFPTTIDVRKISKYQHIPRMNIINPNNERMYKIESKVIVNGHEMNKITTLTETEVNQLFSTIRLLKLIAKEEGCLDTKDCDILAFVASYLDPDLLEKTQYQRSVRYYSKAEEGNAVRKYANFIFSYLDKLNIIEEIVTRKQAQ